MATLKLTKILHGASPHADEPVLVATLGLNETEVAGIAAGSRRLSALLSGWFNPTQADIRTATDAGRFVAELALAILNERGGALSLAHAESAEAGTRLIIGFHHPRASLLGLEAALRLALGAGSATEQSISQALETAWKSLLPLSPDPQASLLIAASRRRGVPVRAFDWSSRTWQHGWGRRAELLFEASPRTDASLGRRLTTSKVTGRQLAEAAGFAILPGAVVTRRNDLERASSHVGFPCVLKPLGGKQSKGVTTDIRDPATLESAWVRAQIAAKGPALLERHAPGEAYRLMVIRGSLWKAVARPRPSVIGDGAETVRALAERRNRRIMAARRPHSLIGPAPLDDEFRRCLGRQGLSPDSVPAKGAKVVIRDIPMLSLGASDYRDATAELHPDVRAAAENLATLLGIDSCGIDLIAEDPGRPETCFFLEANMTPGLRLVQAAGVPEEEIARVVVGDRAARLPHAVVLCPRERHAEIRQLLPRDAGLGWTDGRACGIGARVLPAKVTSPCQGLDLLVRNPSVTALALLVDPADLLAEGLPGEKPDLVLSLDGVRLEPEWSATVARIAARHVATADPEEARKLLAGALAG